MLRPSIWGDYFFVINYLKIQEGIEMKEQLKNLQETACGGTVLSTGAGDLRIFRPFYIIDLTDIH